MAEPLHEASETNWLAFLHRFDTEIYPVLFKKFGYTKGEALIVWQLSLVQETLDAVAQELHSPS